MFNKNKIAFVLLSTIALNVVSTQPAKADAVVDILNNIPKSIVETLLGNKTNSQIQETTNVIGAPVSTPTQVEVPVQTEEVYERSAWEVELGTEYAQVLKNHIYENGGTVEQKYATLHYSDEFYENIDRVLHESITGTGDYRKNILPDVKLATEKLSTYYPTFDKIILEKIVVAVYMNMGWYSGDEIMQYTNPSNY
jgi:hypothetical protein